MKSTDDFLERLKKEQAKRKKSILNRVKGIFKRHARKVQFAGLFAGILSVLALLPGVGYSATVNVTSWQLLVEGHPCYGIVYRGTVNASFSPFLYPVNHLFGSTVSTEFTRLCSEGESAEEYIIVEILLSEFQINVPFFCMSGLILAIGLEKAVKKWRSTGFS